MTTTTHHINKIGW